MTQRNFNSMSIDDDFLVKASNSKEKIRAERRWFALLPDALDRYTPIVRDGETSPEAASYRTQYLHHPTLSDLIVFGKVPAHVWQTVFEACDAFLTAAAAYRGPPISGEAWSELYGPKTMRRLEEFAGTAAIDLDRSWRINGRLTPSLRQIVEDLARRIEPAGEEHVCVTHGDFCFSNIFFDFKSRHIVVIDPRGLGGNEQPALYGDNRYDVAKLHHSVIGTYDHIVAGRFALRRIAENTLELDLPRDHLLSEVQSLFTESGFLGSTPDRLRAHEISTLLFLSMLPLHGEDPNRQIALLANGLRLYAMLDGEAS